MPSEPPVRKQLVRTGWKAIVLTGNSFSAVLQHGLLTMWAGTRNVWTAHPLLLPTAQSTLQSFHAHAG